MKPELDYTVLTPSDGSMEALTKASLLDSFSEQVIAFVSDLSNALMRDQRTVEFPEIIAMAYWLRKANVKRMQQDYEANVSNLKMPRGLVFHIAPSNVDTIFIYSLFLSVFAGNKNIVRLSSTPNEQVDAILAVFNETVKQHVDVGRTLLIVRYDHSEEISQYFSSQCDVRMIWGGDETISRIRSIPLPPRAKELTFADRFSMALIDVAGYLAASDEQVSKCAENFYNDSFWFDQMACSSPRMVCWLAADASSEQATQAQQRFWQALEQHLQTREHSISAAAVMDKLVAQCSYAIEGQHAVSIPEGSTALASRVQYTGVVDERFREIHCGSGLFLEVGIGQLPELSDFVDQKLQTVACFGVNAEAISEYVSAEKPAGIDRFVAFGEALNFSPIWDGYNLLEELSRNVDVSRSLNS